MNSRSFPLLDRYLGAIALLLPEAERADILRELRANLEAEIEDRESASGRAISDDELAALLKAHGHPAAVAARYQPQRFLIGPVMWPYFWLGCKVLAVAVLVGAFAKTFVVTILQSEGWAWALVPARFPAALLGFALPVFAVWVLLMALAERGWSSRKDGAEWDPKELDQEGVASLLKTWAEAVRLGGVNLAGGFRASPDFAERFKADQKGNVHAEVNEAVRESTTGCADWKRARPSTFAKAFGEFFGAGVALVAWYLLFHATHWFTGGVRVNLVPAPVWSESYDYVMGLLAVQIGVAALAFLRPSSRFLFKTTKAVTSVIGIAIVVPFLKATSLVQPVPAVDGAKDVSFLVAHIDRWAYPVLWLVIAITAISAIKYATQAAIALFTQEK